MDYSSDNMSTGASFPDMPLDFGLAFTMAGSDMVEPAMKGYAALTEAEKEQVILRCKDVKTKSEMQKVVDSMVPGADIQAIYQEEKERFS